MGARLCVLGRGRGDGGGRRALKLTLSKDNPHGVVVWWTRALEGEEPVDTRTFPDRKRGANAEANQSVWEEATRLFKEKVKNREKVLIDLGGSEPAPAADDAAGVSDD